MLYLKKAQEESDRVKRVQSNKLYKKRSVKILRRKRIKQGTKKKKVYRKRKKERKRQLHIIQECITLGYGIAKISKASKSVK